MESSFEDARGLRFYARRWAPPDSPRANLVLLHGYAEHCSRYDHVARAFTAAGIAVHAYDQRWHGHSPGPRGRIARFDQLLDDLDVFLAHMDADLAEAPRFFLGHSLGGLVLARYVQTRPVDAAGLIFTSPFLSLPADTPAALLALARVISALAPWLPVGAVDNTKLTRDSDIGRQADADPLGFHGRVNARTGAQFQRAIAAAQAEFSRITAPIYVIHGGADAIVPASGSRRLCEAAASADKTLRIYDDGFHELWNDYDRDAVIDGMVRWAAERVAGC